jgi:hypothetical protein
MAWPYHLRALPLLRLLPLGLVVFERRGGKLGGAPSLSIRRLHLLPGDREVALDIDRYGFAIGVRLEAGHPVARMDRPN